MKASVIFRKTLICSHYLRPSFSIFSLSITNSFVHTTSITSFKTIDLPLVFTIDFSHPCKKKTREIVLPCRIIFVFSWRCHFMTTQEFPPFTEFHGGISVRNGFFFLFYSFAAHTYLGNNWGEE